MRLLFAVLFGLGCGSLAVAEDDRPHLVMLIGEGEYDTKTTLPKFAEEHLAADFRITTIHASEEDPNRFPDLAKAVADADLLLLSIRRRTLPAADLKLLRKRLADGVPVIALRTTSHAFALRTGTPPRGHAEWNSFDREILGVTYANHYGNKAETAPRTMIRPTTQAKTHPIDIRLPAKPQPVRSWLYRSKNLSADAVVLMTGQVGNGPVEPVTWLYDRPDGGCTFYTSLGHPDDFKQPFFAPMLKSAAKFLTTKRAN